MNPDEFKTELASSADALAQALTTLGGVVAGAAAVAVTGYVALFHGESIVDGMNELIATAPDQMPYPVAVLAATATLAVGVVGCGLVLPAGDPPRFWRMAPADFARGRARDKGPKAGGRPPGRVRLA